MSMPPKIVDAEIQHFDHHSTSFAAMTFISDMDRCEHGRHAIDPCFGCEGGQSLGNPMARDILRYTRDGEVVIGYTLAGAYMYVLPSVEDSRTGPKVKLVERH